jgi:four helix bundle protein
LIYISIMGKDAGFRELEAWKAARKLRREVSAVTKNFPKFEQYQLTQQITNSSRSVSANIAEGYGRFHYKETTKHCRIARGSLDETLDHLIEACDECYIDSKQLEEMTALHERCRNY